MGFINMAIFDNFTFKFLIEMLVFKKQEVASMIYFSMCFYFPQSPSSPPPPLKW